MTHLSAVICTHNRAYCLAKAIKSLANQTLPKGEYEILVVDNASTDNTKDVVKKECSGIPNLSYLYEPVLGISRARNKGWRSAKGTYVCYLDDDADASPEWLEKIINIFQTYKLDLGCVGGRIDPVWPDSRPSWITKNIEFCLAIFDYSDKPVVLNGKDTFLSTCNMAVPKDVLAAVGGFDNNFGARGAKLIRGEDTLLQMKIIKKGYACLYHPGIVVKHYVLKSRLRKKYFIQWTLGYGVSRARIQMYLESLSVFKRLQNVKFIMENRLFSSGGLLKLMTQFNNAKYLESNCSTSYQIGRMLGFLGILK